VQTNRGKLRIGWGSMARSLFFLTILLVVSVSMASATDTHWRVNIKADNGSGSGAATASQLGVYPTSTDGLDTNDAEAVYTTDITQSYIWAVSVISGKTYSRDLKAGDLGLPKAWDIRVAAGPASAHTQMRLLFFTAGSTLLPPARVPEASGPAVRYRLVMIDNKGIQGAPANGSSWIIPIPVVHSSSVPFYVMPVNLPIIKLSTYTHASMINEGYQFRLYQEPEPEPMSIIDAKKLPNGACSGLLRGVVTFAQNDWFYIESQDRSAGIKVRKVGHNIPKGHLLDVSGVLATSDNQERLLDECLILPISYPHFIFPLGMTNRAMGGGDLPGGQLGMPGSSGLNNIGLLVRTPGRVEYINGSSFRIDDGSGTPVTCIAPEAGLNIDPNWCFASVTGISSRQLVPGFERLLLVRSNEDISSISYGTIYGYTLSAFTPNIVESPHPYADNYDQTWTVTGPPGTTSMRLHFNLIRICPNDYLLIKNAAGEILQTFTNRKTGNDWTSWVPGNIVKMQLISDGTTNDYGFLFDGYEAVPHPTASGVSVTLDPSGRTAVTNANGFYYFDKVFPGVYTVTPSQTGRTFAPASSEVSVGSGSEVQVETFVRN